MPPSPTTSADALSQMTQAQGQMQDPSAIMQGEQQSLGVPQAQQQVSGLRQAIANTTNLLNNVTPSVEGRTANSLVTSAQANRQIQNESAPIAKTLGDQTTKEAQSESDLKDLMSQASNNTNLKVQGQDQKLSFLKNVYDALFGREQAKAQADQAAADTKMKQDQFNASQSLEQQKLAEQQREANQSNSLEQQKLNTPTPSAPTTQNVTAALRNQISSQRLMGSDGHVAPSTLATMYNTWMNYGLGDNEFWTAFQGLWNPKQADYGTQFNKYRNA